MNKRIALYVLLAMVLFLAPGNSHARYLNINTGRFQTMDTFQGNNEDPLSLHKYLYCQGNPVNMSDPLGLDVYKLVVYGKDDPLGLVHHRMIVGDDGHVGSYILEKGGNGLDLVRTAYLTYEPYRKLTAATTVEQQTGGATISSPNAWRGYIAQYVKTSQADDSALNQAAQSLNGKPVRYIFILNDCGTFANDWIKLAQNPYSNFHASWGLNPILVTPDVDADSLSY